MREIEPISVFKYLYIWLEEAGAGGACFRNLYRDFLKESLKYIDNENLTNGYKGYKKIAQAWKEIAELLLEVDKGKIEKLKETQKKIFEVYELEKNALQILKSL